MCLHINCVLAVLKNTLCFDVGIIQIDIHMSSIHMSSADAQYHDSGTFLSLLIGYSKLGYSECFQEYWI